jgi:hypothetical protein
MWQESMENFFFLNIRPGQHDWALYLTDMMKAIQSVEISYRR